MKLISIVAILLVGPSSHSQSILSGKYQLNKFGTVDKSYYDRSKENIDDRQIVVDFKTSDDDFNSKMNKSPAYFFSQCYYSFVDDSNYVLKSLSIANGVYANELMSGSYTIDTVNRILQFNQLEPVESSYYYIYTLNENHLFLTDSSGKPDIIYEKLNVSNQDHFDQPWKTPNPAIIIDAYGPNIIDWEKMKNDPNVMAVIHKCSEGLILDKSFEMRSAKAKKMGYLWGSYHLGRSGDPIAQADFYLQHVNPDEDLIALDLEDLDDPRFMNLENALKFIDHVKNKTGKYPLLYCNNNVLNIINERYGSNSSFSKCPLWYARFKKTVTDFNVDCWQSYTLWQFSSEINCRDKGHCLYNVPGTDHDMDINVYSGSQEELKMLWPINPK